MSNVNTYCSDPIEYYAGTYFRSGKYIRFLCNTLRLQLPHGFQYNIKDSEIDRNYEGKYYGKVAVIGWETEVKVFETKENSVSKFKVGQKVYHIMYGMGIVKRRNNNNYPISGYFENSEECQYFSEEGKSEKEDINPILLTLEEARAKGYDVPKQKIVKEKVVYINLYGQEERSYVHSTEELAKANARVHGGNL